MNNLDKTQVDDVSDNNTRSTNDNAKKHHEEASCLLFIDEGNDGYIFQLSIKKQQLLEFCFTFTVQSQVLVLALPKSKSSQISKCLQI